MVCRSFPTTRAGPRLRDPDKVERARRHKKGPESSCSPALSFLRSLQAQTNARRGRRSILNFDGRRDRYGQKRFNVLSRSSAFSI